MAEYIVETEHGKVKGHEKDGILEFLGIPYAKPPVGELPGDLQPLVFQVIDPGAEFFLFLRYIFFQHLIFLSFGT